MKGPEMLPLDTTLLPQVAYSCKPYRERYCSCKPYRERYCSCKLT